jgi:hypothetical protein
MFNVMVACSQWWYGYVVLAVQGVYYTQLGDDGVDGHSQKTLYSPP